MGLGFYLAERIEERRMRTSGVVIVRAAGPVLLVRSVVVKAAILAGHRCFSIADDRSRHTGPGPPTVVFSSMSRGPAVPNGARERQVWRLIVYGPCLMLPRSSDLISGLVVMRHHDRHPALHHHGLGKLQLTAGSLRLLVEPDEREVAAGGY